MTSPISASDDEGRELMHAFAELALITVDTAPAEQTLRRVTGLAKQTLPGVEDVSLTLVEHGQPRTIVFTGPLGGRRSPEVATKPAGYTRMRPGFVPS